MTSGETETYTKFVLCETMHYIVLAARYGWKEGGKKRKGRGRRRQ